MLEINMPLARVMSVTSASMTVDLSPQHYQVVDPAVFVFVEGGTQSAGVARTYENVADLGYVCTKLQLSFAQGDVGKKFNLLILPQ